MKKFNMINTLKKLSIIVFVLLSFISCDNDLEEINVNPNDPEVVPPYGVFNAANKYLFDNTRDEWWGGRLNYPWAQHWAQVNYTEEDRYQYRETTDLNGFNDIYRAASNLKWILTQYGTNPAVGDNEAAVCRIMLTYTFLQLVSTYGDIPYYSFGSEDPDFQALDVTNDKPKYASQQKIYVDLMKELKEANQMINISLPLFGSQGGDNIYDGDMSKWKKFANSLRLRIANRVKDVIPSAATEMSDAVAQGVFTSNADNAAHHYYGIEPQGSPLYVAFFVDNRTDFAVASTFVDLLTGRTGNVGVFDPRLAKMAAPNSADYAASGGATYTESYDPNDYTGMPYGVENDVASIQFSETTISLPSAQVLSISFAPVLMTYAEVEFLLSEMNGWDQTHYENGVAASLEQWGVNMSSPEAMAYMAALPAANEEEVITQKYISLYLESAEAWAEFRRTGYPSTLILPGETGSLPVAMPGGVQTYVFTPLANINHVPYRLPYPLDEGQLNGEMKSAAVSLLSNGDTMDSKLIFQP